MKDEELMEICREVLDAYPDKVNNYHLGKTGLMGVFIGEAMKKSKGKADPKKLVEFMNILLIRKKQ